jgi:hypothetical protein
MPAALGRERACNGFSFETDGATEDCLLTTAVATQRAGLVAMVIPVPRAFVRVTQKSGLSACRSGTTS